MYATQFDTRWTYDSFVNFRWVMGFYFDDIRCVADVTDEYSIIFLVTCTASEYEEFRKIHDTESAKGFIEWDYFNFNEIEEDD